MNKATCLKVQSSLCFSRRERQKKKQAELVVGDEYFIYLLQGDWQQSGSDEWTGIVNEQVRLRINPSNLSMMKFVIVRQIKAVECIGCMGRWFVCFGGIVHCTRPGMEEYL